MRGKREEAAMTRFGPFEFDSLRRQLTCKEREVHLTPKAFDLLAMLLDAAPRVMQKRELHERLWPNGVVSDATLIGLVKELRRALADRDRQVPLIRTVHRVGYAFAGQLTRSRKSNGESWRWLIAAGRRVPLLELESTIGRDPQSTLQLDDSTVSRHHARITLQQAGATLEDLGSKNGTCVGGTPIAAPTSLHDGDRISFGRIDVTYRESSTGLSTATQLSRAGSARARRE